MNKISKYISISAIALSSIFVFSGCSKQNSEKELSKKIEGETTELIYSIESMDDLRIEDLNEKDIAVSAAYVVDTGTAYRTKQQQNRMRGVNPKTNSDNTTKTGTATLNRTSSGTTVTSTMNESKESEKLVELSTNDFGDAEKYSEGLISKRAEVMLLCSKLRKGEIKLSKEKLARVNECLELIESTSKYLKSTKGSLEKDYKTANTTASKVALREKLAIRQAKIQTSILAMDEIISIMKDENPIKLSNNIVSKENKTIADTNTNNSTKNIYSNNKTTNNTKNSNNKTNSSNNSTTSVSKNKQNTTNIQTNPTTQNTTNGQKNLNQTNNDAVSILVQPIKTSTTNQSTTNTNKSNRQQFTVRPREVSDIYHRLPTISAFSFPEKPQKAVTLPYVGNV